MLTPYEKGFAVYMMGARDDQPNVPEHYEPTEEEREEYLRGQVAAVQHVTDMEE